MRRVCAICGEQESNRESDPHGVFGYHKFTPKSEPPESQKRPVVNPKRDAAAVLAMCAWARRQISKIEDHAKAIADVSFPEEKTAGVVGGTVVSYTSRVQRKPELKITNPDGFVEWVRERWPGEIVGAVRESFLNLVLYPNAVEHHGVIVDEHGEVCEHAELADPVVYTTTRLTKDADAVLKPLLANESLTSLPDLIDGRPTDLDARAS